MPRTIFRKAWSSDEKLDGKTVLITGANTGIGKETAKDLAKRGAKIIIACRDMEKAQEALKEIIETSGNDNVKCMKLDLSDTKSIREFAEAFNRDEPKLNILINNAGVMICPYGKTADGFETQIGVNHLGHFLLTHLLFDLIKRSAPARIVIVSSVAHVYGSINLEDINSEKRYDKVKAYSQSKLANILFSRSLAKRLEGTGVTTYSLHPGAVKTDLQRHAKGAWSFLLTLTRPFFKNAVEGAQTSLYCAVEPSLENETGQYYSDCTRTSCSSAGKDDDMAQKLWELSCHMLNITWE
ncbi:retinol dehydrogenase 12-like [Amphiprion ocellaris]|uniref:retinol dehydrogenase 12-like n=1 Tax=Amphiprion ocellaris TaxID=80972 RepID=UPI000C30752F|nr:retinol dehydrogenase 12-like [Amphiprion ocellaris]